jgi:ribonuclease HI
MESEPLIFWTDASCYDTGGGAVAGIAVVDHRTARILATQVLWGCCSSFKAELEAIRLAFGLCRDLHPQQVEVRSDCQSAVAALTAPSGVRLCHGYRGDNKAHKTARRVGKNAAAAATRLPLAETTTPVGVGGSLRT